MERVMTNRTPRRGPEMGAFDLLRAAMTLVFWRCLCAPIARLYGRVMYGRRHKR